MEIQRSMRSNFSIFLALVALVVLSSVVSGPAMAAEGTNLQVLGSDGTVTKLVDGLYGELFAEDESGEVAADSSVLALEQIGPDGAMVRWLVPGTHDGSAGEEPAGLVLDDRSGAIFLLWETTISGIHPVLRLTRFDGEIFSSSIDITSGAFADKGTAQLLITREAEAQRSYLDNGGDQEGIEDHSMVVHVVWWQVSPGGSVKLYAPVVIDNGSLSQQPPILDLSRFTPTEEGEAGEVKVEIQDLLAIRQGETSQTVVMGFLELASGNVQTLRMDVVPVALSDLGDKFGAHIVIVGLRSGTRRAMADAVWPLILELGDDLHESVKIYTAAHLEELILSSEEELTPEGLETLSRRLSDEILTITSEVESGGLARRISDLVETVPRAEESTRHVLTVRALSSRPAPEIGQPEGLVRFFLSDSGYHVMVVWEENGRVFFRESIEAGWGETGSVEATEILPIPAIYQMLEQRIASR